jgi:hypothetical protein
MNFVKKLAAGAVLCLCLCAKTEAQSFSYTTQRDSSSYVPLAGANTLLVNSSFENGALGFALPFQFSGCDHETDTVIIEPNGFIVLDKEHEFAVVAFNEFRANADTAGILNYSVSYLTAGVTGSRICKIQFYNFSQGILSSQDFLSYQVWLHENGNKISFHIGNNSYSTIEEHSLLMGVINRKMDSANKAYLLSGSQSSPTGNIVTNEGELVYLSGFPAQGVFYTLTPGL